VLGFFAVIGVGTALLLSPMAAHEEVSFLEALFTAVSATTITGLVVVDTAQTWTIFGLAVILIMIQIGGLGFMSVITVFFFMMHKKIGLSQRLLVMQTMSLHDMQGVVKLIKHVLIGTIMFQTVGAIVLFARFAPSYGIRRAFGLSVFHAVSAFCNAGFDLMVDNSLTAYFGDRIITIVIAALVFIGGLGFFVWEDIWRNRKFRRLHIHSKLVLISSFWLVLVSGLFYFFAERQNMATFGGMAALDTFLAILFQTVMPRSGGLIMVEQGHLRDVSQAFTTLLMLIGGSAGSTAGGIKNVTVLILALSAISSLRGRTKLFVFGRTIPTTQVLNALSIASLVLMLWICGAIIIAFAQPELPFSAVLFETASAIATCGLSIGITAYLTSFSQAVLILLMLFGRLGIMTLGMAVFFNRNKLEKTKYPDTWVIVG